MNYCRILSAFILLSLLQACTQPPQEVALSGRTMGTTYHLKFVQPAEGEAEAIDEVALQIEVDAALVQVNRLMSTYDPQSELSLLNKAPANEAFVISSATAFVLQEAMRLGQLSDGVLDVTVGPLVNLWGFGPDKRPEKTPDSEALDAIKQYVGLDKFSLVMPNEISQVGNVKPADELASTSSRAQVFKHHPKVYIDLSTIAKGYGVDVVADVIAQHGIDNYLVEIGGEMRVAGKKANGSDWRIAIEKPTSAERSVQKIISIDNNAIATSGDYRNYFEQDGVRYSHLIDPSTGYPIQHNLVSVTVVHPSSMTADGLATALNVMGTTKAIAVAEAQQLAVFLVYKQDGEFIEYSSPAFNERVTIVGK